MNEADLEKLRLEVKQRKRRTDMAKAEQVHLPAFFTEMKEKNF